MKFDVILVTDTSQIDEGEWSRGYGAHRIANHLRVNGYSTLVIDFCSAMSFDYWKEICDSAIGENTRMIGFSTTWWPYRNIKNPEEARTNIIDYNLDAGVGPNWKENQFMYNAVRGNSKPWIDYAKSLNNKIKIAIGGPKLDWYTDFPADYFVNGFGENQIIDLLSDKRRLWPKIIEHDVNSSNREWGWTTCSTRYTEYDFIRHDEVLNLEIARGCKFQCNFCSFPLLGQKDTASYYKTEETIYNELMENYNRWGSTQYSITDDTFNDDISKIEMMVRIVKRLPFTPKFYVYIRVDLIAKDPRQIELLKEMGVRWCYIGLESFHPVASKYSGKGMAAQKRKDILHKMYESWGNNVTIDVGYIVGLPGETEEFLREQAAWFSRDDCPINRYIVFVGLIINPAWSLRYVFPSKMDREPEKFGYTIPDRSKPNLWIKDDGTDILSYERACELSNELNEIVSNRKNKIETSQMEREYFDPVTQYFEPLIKKLKND